MSNTSPSPSSVDVTGKRFGRLVAVQRNVFKRKCGQWSSRYQCQCDCGATTYVDLSNLTSGATRSCGCLRREEVSQRKRLPDRHVALRQVWNYYRRNATMRSLDWGLEFDEFSKIVLSHCHYCGAEPCNETKIRSFTLGQEASHRVFRTNGVDRIDNGIGYNSDNCVPACKRCNIAKSTMSKGEFLSWIETVHNHQNNKDI